MSIIKIGQYDYDGLCHAFMYQQRDKEGFIRGSTGGDRLSFYNNSIYSYRSLLAILKEDYILTYVNTANYSSTSKGHYRHLVGAINTAKYEIYNVEFANYSSQMKVYVRNIKELLASQARARKSNYEEQIRRKITEAISYATRFKQRRTTEYKWIKKIQNNPIRYAKEVSTLLTIERKKNEKKLEKKMISRLQKVADRFLGINKVIVDKKYIGTVFLLRKKDEIITSNSVRVNIRDAVVLYKRWTNNKNLLGYPIGMYTVVINNKDRVKIGCTTICAAELHRFFKPLVEEKIEKGIK